MVPLRDSPWPLVGALILFASAAAATVSGTSYEREVSTFALASLPDGETLFETDEDRFQGTGPFDEVAASAVFDPVTGTTAGSSATQTSTLEPLLVVATGGFSGSATVGGGSEFAEALGVSRLRYTFDVAAPIAYRVFGTIEAAGNGVANLVLNNYAGILVLYHSIDNQELEVDQSGMLQPGSHEFTISTSGYAQAVPDLVTTASGGYSLTLILGTTTSAPDRPALAETLRVFPNPIRTHATIVVPAASQGDVTIFDVTGRMIRTLGPATASQLRWDARDDRGRPVAAGVYFVRSGDRLVRTSVLR